MTSDPQSVLRQADPARSLRPYTAQDSAALLDRAVAAPPGRSRRRRRRHTAALGAAGAALLACGGGVAYAVFSQPAETALGIACTAGQTEQEYLEWGVNSFLSTSSGDPVADCAAQYVRLRGAAPELQGYTYGGSSIAVVPESWPVPSDWRPLAPSFRNDAARLELDQRLGDTIDGPQSSCRSADAVEALVRTDLADLGLRGWQVERLEQAARADGRSSCAFAWVDEQGRSTVIIQGTGTVRVDPGPSDSLDLVEALRRDVVETCLPLPAARAAAERAITGAGFELAQATITTLEDPEADCTRVELPAAGVVTVVLRGPAA
jgi:hypothetical protein